MAPGFFLHAGVAKRPCTNIQLQAEKEKREEGERGSEPRTIDKSSRLKTQRGEKHTLRLAVKKKLFLSSGQRGRNGGKENGEGEKGSFIACVCSFGDAEV